MNEIPRCFKFILQFFGYVCNMDFTYRDIVENCSNLLAYEKYVLLLRIIYALKKQDMLRTAVDTSLGSTTDISFQVFCEQICVIEAQTLYSFGLLDQTWEVLKGVLEENPSSIPSFYLIAQVYIQRGWPDKALHILQRLEDHVHDHKVHNMLRQQCIDIKKQGHVPIHKDAQNIINSDSIPDLLLLVRQFLVVGKRNIAEKILLKAYQIRPEDPHVCNFIWVLKGNYASEHSLTALLQNGLDFIEQMEATTPIQVHQTSSDTDFFLRSVSLETEQLTSQDDFPEETTDETNYDDQDDQTSTFSMDFTAELTAMVDDHPIQTDKGEQSEDHIGLGFLFQGLDHDDFLSRDGQTSAISDAELKNLGFDEHTLHTKRVDIVYMDDVFEESEVSVSVALDEDSQVISLLGDAQKGSQTNKRVALISSPQEPISKSTSPTPKPKIKPASQKIGPTPVVSSQKESSSPPSTIERSLKSTSEEQKSRFGIRLLFICIAILLIFVFTRMVIPTNTSQTEISTEHIASMNYKNIRSHLDEIDSLYSKSKPEYVHVQLLRSWLFFESDYNPSQTKKLQGWRDSHQNLDQTVEWIVIDILLSLSSVYEEQELSKIQQKLSHVYKQLVHVKDMDINQELYDIMMYEFLSVKEYFDLQGIVIEGDTTALDDFFHEYHIHLSEYQKTQRLDKNIHRVLYSKDLDYIQAWLHLFSSEKKETNLKENQDQNQEKTSNENFNHQAIVLHRQWLTFLQKFNLHTPISEQEEEYELSTIAFGSKRKALTFILQSLPRSENLLERNIKKALQISNESIFISYVSAISLQGKNPKLLKGILENSNKCRLYYTDCFALELLHAYQYDQISYLKKSYLHQWQQNTIQSIRNEKIPPNIENLSEYILIHYFTGKWSEYDLELQKFQDSQNVRGTDLEKNLRYLSPVLYSLHMEMLQFVQGLQEERTFFEVLETGNILSQTILLQESVHSGKLSNKEAFHILKHFSDIELEVKEDLPVITMQFAQNISGQQIWNSQIKQQMLYFNQITR